MRKTAIVTALLASLIGGTAFYMTRTTALADTAFGIQMGASKKELNLPDKGNETYSYKVNPPTPNEEFDLYSVILHEKTGVCAVQAIKLDIKTEKDGKSARERFYKIRNNLSAVYGHPYTIDHIDPDGYYGAKRHWMRAILRDERILKSIWRENQETEENADGKRVVLTLDAFSETSAALVLWHTFDNIKECSNLINGDADAERKSNPKNEEIRGPFGVEMGVESVDLRVESVIKNGTLYEIQPDAPHDDFQKYIAGYHRQTGVCMLEAISKIPTDRRGQEVQSKFSEFERILAEKYGEPKISNSIKSDGYYTDEKEWMKSVIERERELSAYWGGETKPNNDANIRNIRIYVDAYVMTEGEIKLRYEFDNYDECARLAREDEEASAREEQEAEKARQDRIRQDKERQKGVF